MFIIFGTNTSDTIIGYRKTQTYCEHCHNTVNKKVFSRSDKLTLFFVPTIPINKVYYEACPICNFGREIPESDIYRDI